MKHLLPSYQLLLWLGLSFLLVTCSKEMIEISQNNFQPEVATQENLVFNFDRDMVGDTLLSVWDSTEFVKISPKVEGKFKWESPRKLIFSPLKGFAPSTEYEASPNPILGSGEMSVNTRQKVKFHTPFLELVGQDIFWSQNGRNTQQLRIDLLFNYNVEVKDLAQLLSLNIAGQNRGNLRVISRENTDRVALVLDQSLNEDLDGKELVLKIASGIKCSNSQYESRETMGFTAKVPSKNKLQILEVSGEYEGRKSFIRIKANQAIPVANAINNIKIEPEVPHQFKELDNGLKIEGIFKPGVNYQVTFGQQLRGVFNVALGRYMSRQAEFKIRKPAISFVKKNGGYLSRKGSKNIAIRIDNVEEVSLKIYKIYEQNLSHFFADEGHYYSSREGQNLYEGRLDLSNYGDLIVNKNYKTKSLPLVADNRVLNLDLEDFKNEIKGIYLVQVVSSKEQFVNSSRIISISDLGLIVKKNDQDAYVFVNSILDAEAISGAKVKLISQSNRIIAEGTSDGEGIVKLESYAKNTDSEELEASMITVRKGEDFNYIHFNRSHVDRSDFEVSGLRFGKRKYQAFLYAERNLYRPGETIHYNTIVRTLDWENARKMPIKVELTLPNGRVYNQIQARLSEEGSYSGSFKMPASALTGTYNLKVYMATGELLDNLPISIEEFMPDRIKMRVQLTEKGYRDKLKTPLRAGSDVHAKLEVRNLFGPPAANKAYQMSLYISQKEFVSDGYKDYDFSLSKHNNLPSNSNNNYEEREGQTNRKGEAYETFKISSFQLNRGLLEAKLYATVFDENGRSISQNVSENVYTQDAFLGIKELNSYHSAGSPIDFKFIAVNKDDFATSSAANVQVIRYDWQTVLEQGYGGEARYVSRRQERVLVDKDINIANIGSVFQFVPEVSGEYELRLGLPNSEYSVSKRFYAYAYESTVSSSFEVDRDGKVSITLDKPKYQVGETATALFTTPFDGRLLVTVEQDKVMKHFYLRTKNRSVEAKIPLSAEHLPNTYITATLIRPMSDGAIPLTVAHGFASVSVEKPEAKLELEIIAAEKSESNTKQTIKVKTNKAQAGVEVTLAVVDEGILQIKNYQTPAPHPAFYAKRALEVSAYDLYPQLFPEISLNRSSVGGGGVDFDARSNPMVNKRVKLVSFWSGRLQTNAAGEASYTIDIPYFSGTLRIMAIAHKDDAFGSAESKMIVADPVVISTGLPRFLSPNDKIKMPVSLFNTTNLPADAQVQVQATPNLKIEGQTKQNISIGADNEKNIEFEITAAQVIDSAKVMVRVQSMGRTFSQELDINIRPIVGLVKDSDFGVVSAGQRVDIPFTPDLVPSTASAQLLVSRSPLAQFAESLEYLVEYPHGCLEQITSAAFPQLYAKELMEQITPDLRYAQNTEERIQNNVQNAIFRLQSLQSYDGGLRYWGSGYETHWFGTAYALHFMLEAEKLGYQVNEPMMTRMRDFLKERLRYRRDNLENYEYFNDQNYAQSRKILPKEAVYSLYVLTLSDDYDLPSANYFRLNADKLALDSRYLLALVFKMIGDTKSYQSLLPNRFAGERSMPDLKHSFGSYLRDQALTLNALLEQDPENGQIPIIAQSLSLGIKNANYLNTQERAFTLLALGKLSKLLNNSRASGQVLVNGNRVGQINNNALNITQNLLGNKASVQADGAGNLFYFWQTKGLSASGKVKEGDSFLKVRRTFYNRQGEVVQGNTFRQNDLVVVRITVEPIANERIENVVITDMLPAGLEIENPRLSESPILPWLKSSYYDRPDHLDIRDDRINYYLDVESPKEQNRGGERIVRPQTFFYLARAVTKGTFQLGPVSADAMYNGSYHSYSGSGTVRIIDRNNPNN